jgi:hypothetical protein
MTAYQMQTDPGRDLRRAIMEAHAAIVDAPDGRNDVIDFECVAQHPVAHAAAGAKSHLGVLNVKGGRRKKIDAARMIEMHVR